MDREAVAPPPVGMPRCEKKLPKDPSSSPVHVGKMDLEPQRIGDGDGDQRFRQSMSLAVSKNTMASES
jgi:hypothetical protein